VNAQGPDDLLCTAEVNSLWPHRYEQDAEVTADTTITPGQDTCGTTEAGHAEYTPERIRRAEWREACYRKAVEIDAAAPHLGHAADALVAEAHAEALHVDADREQLRWQNGRCDQLNREAHAGRNSPDPATRALWIARDEAWTRASACPTHDIDEF